MLGPLRLNSRSPSVSEFTAQDVEGAPTEVLAGAWARILAKTVDMLIMAVTIVGFTAGTDSYLVGLLMGYFWWMTADWSGSPGKWLFGITVRGKTEELGFVESCVRNLPIVAVNLPHRLHQALLGIDRQTYREEYAGWIIGFGVFEVGLLLWLVYGLFASRSHLGDRLASTRVIPRPKKG